MEKIKNGIYVTIPGQLPTGPAFWINNWGLDRSTAKIKGVIVVINVKRELGRLNGLICQINVLCNDEELEILRDILTNRIQELDQDHLSQEGREDLGVLRATFNEECIKLSELQSTNPKRRKCYNKAMNLLDKRLELILKC